MTSVVLIASEGVQVDAVPLREVGGLLALLLPLAFIIFSVLPVVLVVYVVVLLRRIERSSSRTVWLLERWLNAADERPEGS